MDNFLPKHNSLPVSKSTLNDKRIKYKALVKTYLGKFKRKVIKKIFKRST